MGEAPSLPTSVAFTCRKRARSLAIGSPEPRTWGGDQSDQVESGLAVLPLRVCTSTWPPAGALASQRICPHAETVSVSLTFETKLPRAPAVGSSRCTLPGFDVATATLSAAPRRRAVTWSAVNEESIAHVRSLWMR